MHAAAASQHRRCAQPWAWAVAASAAPAAPPKMMLKKEMEFGVTPCLASAAARFLKTARFLLLRGRRPAGSGLGIDYRPMKYIPATSNANPKMFNGLIGVP